MPTRAEILLEDFSASIGIEKLKFDEQNMCTLLVDNQHRITLLAQGDTQLLLYGILGDLPLDPPKETLLELLAVNIRLASVSGPHLGFEPTSRSILLAYALNLENLSALVLENTIEMLIKNQEETLQYCNQKQIHLVSSSSCDK